MDVFSECTISLVDFGYASSYLDKTTGQHRPKQMVDKFRGNLIFASLNQLNFNATSRKDDIISMSYLLIYMLNRGNLPGIDLNKKLDQAQSFKQARFAKMNYTLDSLCDGRAACMKDFVKEAYDLGSQEKPKYNLMKELLQNKIKNI